MLSAISKGVIWPLFLFSSTLALPLFALGPNKLILPDKTEINITHLLVDARTRAKGLSGVSGQDFGARDGALFVFKREGWRAFWMPDTYFDLDIVFLDKNFKIIHIERNVPHHSSKKGDIPRVPHQWAHYVLEIKGRTFLSKKLKKGMLLQFKGRIFPEQIKPDTRPLQ